MFAYSWQNVQKTLTNTKFRESILVVFFFFKLRYGARAAAQCRHRDTACSLGNTWTTSSVSPIILYSVTTASRLCWQPNGLNSPVDVTHLIVITWLAPSWCNARTSSHKSRNMMYLSMYDSIDSPLQIVVTRMIVSVGVKSPPMKHGIFSILFWLIAWKMIVVVVVFVSATGTAARSSHWLLAK